jgi:hypothetical protein
MVFSFGKTYAKYLMHTNYSTMVYHYTQRQTVVLYYGNSPRRFQQVYTKNLRLHKGVDNLLQFQFLDQAQKKVDVTDKEITFRLMSYDGQRILLEKTLVMLFSATGITEVQISSRELEGIDAQLGFYSLEIPVNQFRLPVFVDDSSGGRGVIEIVDSIYPKFIPSKTIVVPEHVPPEDCCTELTFDSSIINTLDNCAVTIQMFFDKFTGSVQMMGSTIPSGDWYNIGEETVLTSQSDSMFFEPDGHHPYIKFVFKHTIGTVTKMMYR